MERGRGWSDVTAEDVTRIAKGKFEELCYAMVNFEKTERHSPKTRVHGGTVDDAQDGGRDVLLDVKAVPVESATYFQKRLHATPITEDDEVRTAYNCKSGANWLKGVVSDLKNDEKRKRTSRAIEVLKEGGYLKVWTNLKIAVDKELTFRGRSATPHGHIVHVLAKELDQEPEAFEKRVEVLGANELAAWLRAVQPSTLEPWLRELDLEPRLHSVEEWRADHEGDRPGQVAFESDAERKALQQQLHQTLSAGGGLGDEQIVFLVGPPGVGKTRLVLEVLAGDEQLTTSTRVAYTAHEALQEFESDKLLKRHPGALIIVDDCPPDRSVDVRRLFTAQAKRHGDQGARLAVMIPASHDAIERLPQSLILSVSPLSGDAARELAARLAGRPPDDEVVASIVEYAQGYPWFAALLAEEAKGAGRAPHDMREAVQWALAPRHADDPTPAHELDALRDKRGRALVAAALTTDLDWPNLEPQVQDTLAKAVGLGSWDQLYAAAEQCRLRGLLRVRLGWAFKYVTPHVLEREVLRSHFGPGGNDPGGRRLSSVMPALATPLAEALSRANVGQDAMRAVAAVTLDQLDTAQDWTALITHPALTTPRLALAARVAPARTAALLARQVTQASIDVLQEAEAVRRPLIWTLERLSERKSSFDDAERALFRLALAENESYANNATAIWIALFQVELNVTHRPLARRLAVLERHFREGAPAGQQIVLDALAAMLMPTQFRVVTERLDGDPPQATRDEAMEGRLQAWRFLLVAMDAPADEVARHARTLVTEHLRAVVRAGIGDAAAQELLRVTAAFNGRDRTRLREAVDMVQRFEGEAGTRVADVLAPVLQPQSFAERLLDRVATFGTMRNQDEEVAADTALAREGLIDDALLLHLELVLDPQNPRGLAFLHAAATQDDHAVLLPALQAARISLHGARALSVYLQGQRDTGRTALVDEAVDSLVSAGEPTPLAFALSALGATDERLSMLSLAVQSSGLDEEVIAYLRFGNWLAEVTADNAARFLLDVLHTGGLTGAGFALQQSVRRIKREPEAMGALSRVLSEALEVASRIQVDGMVEHVWQEGCGVLLSHGKVAEVARLACLAVAREGRAGHYGWSILARCSRMDADATWGAIRGVLEGRDAATSRFVIRVRRHAGGLVLPEEACLAWVSEDEQRARMLSTLVSPRGKRLPGILRGLLERFGSSGSVARSIAGAIRSTEQAVPSLADFHAAQLAMVEGWTGEVSEVVQEFAVELAAGLRHDVERESAFEEAERIRWG